MVLVAEAAVAIVFGSSVVGFYVLTLVLFESQPHSDARCGRMARSMSGSGARAVPAASGASSSQVAHGLSKLHFLSQLCRVSWNQLIILFDPAAYPSSLCEVG